MRKRTAWEHFGPLLVPYFIGNLTTYVMSLLPTVGIIKANVLGIGVMIYMIKEWNKRIQDKIDQEYYQLLYANDYYFREHMFETIGKQLFELYPENKQPNAIMLTNPARAVKLPRQLR
ncbi:MAG: hypothetical protein VW715_07300 [Rhodospirillales bacterium]